MRDSKTDSVSVVRKNEQARLFSYVDYSKSKDSRFEKNYNDFKRPVTNYGSVKNGS